MLGAVAGGGGAARRRAGEAAPQQFSQSNGVRRALQLCEVGRGALGGGDQRVRRREVGVVCMRRQGGGLRAAATRQGCKGREQLRVAASRCVSGCGCVQRRAALHLASDKWSAIGGRVHSSACTHASSIICILMNMPTIKCIVPARRGTARSCLPCAWPWRRPRWRGGIRCGGCGLGPWVPVWDGMCCAGLGPS